MANNDQNEPSLPTSANSKRTASNLLPRFYRTDSNKKFLQATIDQLTQPGTVKKVNGFIGRQNAKSVSASDIFINATDQTRQNYQLEPSAIIQDELGNINFYKDYIDHINHIDVFGGITSNHEKLNKQEFYSWSPHICWDKFVNYQNYYWLPYGPTPVEVAGQQREIESTYNVTAVDEGDNYAFLLTPNGLTKNPTLTLYRGQTYNFIVSSQGNPFSIKASRVVGIDDRYSEGITNNGIETGTLTFVVGENTPDVLYYVSENSVDTGGVLHVLDIDENTYLNVDSDILGKQTYKMSNGSFLSNGMKVKFIGKVTPEKYAQGYWYVEGVGQQIKLISDADLEIIGNYTQEVSVLFDDTPFDKDPFSAASAYPSKKDYILINKGSPDRNPWSRFNRWFHQDVIKVSSELAGQVPEYDQAARAVRPIIEFNTGLKLYNFGHQAKLNVDVIDTFTSDVFSTIEGTLGYNIDGVDVADGMRILFTADTDVRVKNKIYKANFINVTAPGRIVNFTPLNNIDTTGTITFPSPHSFVTGNQVVYLNNGNSSIVGLTNRAIYYVQVVNETQIKLFTDKLLSTQTSLTASGSSIHSFESYSGTRRQINLVEEADASPIKNETVLIKTGNINQGLMYWFNGSSWLLGQTKTTNNQPPLFDVFDNNGNSYSDTSIYDGSTFSGTKLFSYKVGSTFVDSELGFPLTYQNIDNIGDIVFEFNLISDTFNYKQVTDIISKNTDVGFLKFVTDLANFSYINGWKVSKIKNVQPIVRIFKESLLTNDFPVDVYDNLSDLSDLEVRVYINGKRLDKSLYSVQTTEFKKFVRLTNNVTTSDVVTLKCFAQQEKNSNGYYEIPINLQNNPLNDNLTTFTLGQVIDHVGTIIDNIQTFSGAYPGYGNLRDLGNLSEFGTRFVQHSAPLNMSLYHLGSQNANAFKAIDQARKDYGKFKRTFIITASTSGIDTDPKRHVDFILSKLTADRPKTQPYYVSDMFGFSGNTRLEYVVLDARIKKYPLTQKFDLKNLSNKAVNIYLNGDQLVHGKDYVFGSSDTFFELLVDLKEDDLIEAYEYDSTDGTYCPPTPTKLGLYPAYEPKKYLDTSYDTPSMVIQGHDGSITLAFNDYRDDLILELEKRIFNNLKTSYDDSIINIFDYIPGYDRITDFSVDETNRILSQFFFDWTSNISQDYTKNINFDRLDPFKLNYRGTYSPKGTDLPAGWRGIYKWYLDTDCPHLVPWESLGFSIKPAWWDGVYGEAPYTSNNELLWEDIKNGIIREPNKPIRRLEKYARSILEKGVPVDQTGNLKDPLAANFVDGYINETAGYFEFGDGGPVETAWRRSSYYAYSILQTALLLNPNKILSLGFDRSRVVRNLDNQFVYKDTGLRITLKDLILPSTALSSERTLTAGIVNFIVDYMTSDTASRINSYINDLQLLTNKLGSKLGGFTSKPKFKLLLDSKNPKSTSGVFVPEENYNVFLNTSSPIQKLVYSGVVITKYDDGFEIRGYNNEDPYFKYYQWVESDRLINVGGISESFISWEQNQLYTAGKIVAYGNYYYRVTVGHTSDTTFNSKYYTRLPALPIIGGKDVVLRKSWDTSEELILAYGVKLSNVQQVADFMQGYGTYLEAQGFVFDDFSTNLKVVSNWETSVKEFLFWSTQNWAPGAVLSLSPSADRLVLKTTNAVVNNIQDEFFEYKIFRVDGLKLEPEFTSTYRDSNEFNLSPTNTNHGIFCAVLYLVQKEHVVVLDNRTLFNDIIYDLEPGYRQEKIKVLGYLSRDWSGGFNIPGFTFDQAKIQDWEPWTDYNLGDIVKYKEFYYTAKLSLPGVSAFNSDDWALQRSKPTSSMRPNWDYRAEQFTDYYDLDTDNFDTTQQKFGQHLIGYQKRQYLENIIKDDVSQYKFYQGMIIEKGTQNVLNKLFDVLGADNTDSLTFNEEWALRVGNYGSTNAFEEIEFTLDESQFKISPQPIELVSTIDPTIIDFVYRQTPNNLYIKPIGYNNNPWPTEGTKTFLRTPGYVRYEDVNWPVSDIADFISRDTSAFAEGDYVWCGFESRDWNVYRIIKKDVVVTTSTYASTTNLLTLGTSTPHGLTAGSSIGLKISTIVSGFYAIESVPTSSSIVIKLKPSTTITGFESTTYIYTLSSSRIDHIDNVNNILTYNLKENELVWTDNNGANKWAVYKNSKVYSPIELEYPDIDNVAVTKDGKTFAVIDNVGIKLSIKQVDWIEYQQILWSDVSASTQLTITSADDVVFSDDGTYLAISNSQGYVIIYQKSTSADYQYVTYKSFAAAANSKLAIANKNSTYTLFATSTNKVYAWTSTAWNGGLLITSAINIENIAASADGYYFVISDSTDDSNKGKASLYRDTGAGYDLIESISGQAVGDRLGASIALTDSGNYLAIGIPGKNTNTGIVRIYENDSGTSLYQELHSVTNEADAEYGSKLFFMNNDESLVVFSEKGNSQDSTYVDAGRVDIYDSYNTKFIYGESLTPFSDQLDNYGDKIAVGNNTILVSAPLNATGKLFSYIKQANTKSWSMLHEETPRPNVSKIKKAFLYNSTTDQLVSYLDIVDPVQGKIPGPADQEIKYKTYFDPATYSVGTGAVNVDTGMNWTTSQKGMLWWDLTKAKFLENQGGTAVYKSTTWNKLYETASIDIYEWVETKYSPSEWDKLADTEKGLALGISGLSKYGNSVYSLKQRYDNISKQFTNIYYFWVKNTKIIPNVPGRLLSAADVSALISDPSGYGYSCLALTGSNSFTLVNVANLISDKDINLNVQYWLIDNQEINNHSQWKVISENVSTIIPKEIERKWFHSLIGKDDSDRSVPDFKLPIKQRYGVEFRPRQSMFVNRVEALKQFVERVNSVLAKTLIVDDFNLTALNQSEIAPSAVAGSWDTIIDFETELQFVGTASLVQAQLTPVITNGVLTNVIINNAGSGYVNSPHLRIIGTGVNAAAKAIVDNTGKVSAIEILDSGSGYSDDTMIVIRPYAVLVNSDSTAFDKWSIYQWNAQSKTWNKNKSQSYDVTKFWNYIDWYQTGYNQFTKIDHIVENTYQLVTAEVNTGEIVKVKNIGTGGWLLLEKFDNVVTIDYTQNYKVVGRQDGTIQFSPSLYAFDNTVIGFDNQLFDGGLYDNFAAKELRIIIDAIKNDIFVDDLRQEYLNLFFASIRYVLHEQLLTDWVMKTSFVKAVHNVGELKEKVTYNNDNLANFEDYVNEVKPFRTKVRDYVSSYTKLDTAQQSVTDFDLVPVIDLNSTIVPMTVAVSSTGEIQASSSEIASYPWKHWYDHVGFKIISLDIVDGGIGYIGRPVIKITGGFGTGAEAKAYISNGKVNRVEIISAGSGYLKTPTITLEGGLSTTGTPARVVAVIESEVVRSNKISIKFDRITRNYFVSELLETETFTGTGSRLQFALKWSPVATIGESVVTIDGVDALRNEYTLSTKKSSARGYTSYSGVLTFTTAPKTGASIVITYKKNFEHLTAADRINFYYNPVTGQLGKDLAQLMTGIDYGGVQVTGLGFNISGGWDALPWFSDSWDGFDSEFDDYIVTVGDSTYSYTLPYTPVAGEQINIYVNGTRIDDPYFNVYDGSTTQPNGRKTAPTGVVMQTFVGDGSTKVINLPNLTSTTPIDINAGDKVIFRKSTSDGSFISTSEEIDTQLEGGSFVGTSLTSATGYAPDDINIDGEQFVTPSTSHAPEEIVPGQVFDAVAIKVFHRPAGGAPRIMFKNYVADGATDTFAIGQQFPSNRSVIVKIGNAIVEQNQYSIDWANNSITLLAMPADKQIVSIISFSFNSQTILDLDYFVADGSTLEFITRAPWSVANLQSTVLVNGNVVSYELFNADDTYEIPGNVGIRFAEPVEPGSVINYMIDIEVGDSSVDNTSSVAKSQTIVFDGSTQTYPLINLGADVLPGYGLHPYDTNVIVRVGQQVLRPANVLYFTLTDDNLIYNLPTHKFAPYTIDANKVRVYINGEKLNPGSDYLLDLADISITLSNLAYIDNAKLSVVVDVGYDYRINDNGTITFVPTYSANTAIEVISFYNHVLLDIDRTTDTLTPSTSLVPSIPDTFEFSNKLGGRFELRRPVLAADYVWIVKNGTLLTHSVDYILLDDRSTVQLTDNLLATDVVQVMSFSNNVVQASFGFMQFKDMLNRTHFKRINKNKSSRLAKDLLQTDITIEVVDGSVFTEPNRNLNLPGVVEINGERIEYFTKTGNLLGQLRRGTLGTGVPTTHVKDLIVLDIGSTETIPYTDNTLAITAISDGSTKNIGLNYVPTNKDVIDVFVGGYRLKKNQYVLFKESNNQPYSPEGDSILPPEFTTDGINYGTEISPIGYIRLAEAPRENEKIVVIKKTGHIWNEANKQLVDSNNAIANFLRSVEPIWPEFLTDKYKND